MSFFYFKNRQYLTHNVHNIVKNVKFPFKAQLLTYHLKQLSVAILYCNKDLVTGVKKENRLADKPPKLEPISQDDINIIALVPETTLY